MCKDGKAPPSFTVDSDPWASTLEVGKLFFDQIKAGVNET